MTDDLLLAILGLARPICHGCCLRPRVPSRQAQARRVTERTAMVTTADIADRVNNVLVARLRVDADRIAEASSLEVDLGATSLDMAETIMSLEEEFGIEISDRDAETLHTVGDVMALIRAKLP